MARIRTIKPDFWASDQVTDCSLAARLLFIGIWNFADDAGVIPYKPKTLKAKVFPADDVSLEDIRRMVDELLRTALLGIFEYEGVVYLFVTGWKKHQKIDRPSFRYPSPPKNYEPNPDQLSLALRRTLDEGHPPEGKGKEGNGMEGKGGEPPTIRREDEGDVPLWRQIIVAFDDARVEAYGEMQRRPHPHPDDRQHALRFIEAGAGLELCKSVFQAVCQRAKSNSKRPPWSLEYFQNPIADAIAAAKRPMPQAESRPNGNGAHVPTSQPSKEEVREQMHNRAQVIKRGTYLSAVTIQDVRAMIRLGWLTADDATKAGYVL
jgi:hypothetical protein